LTPALDRDRDCVAYRFCDPECQPGGAPQPGRLIRRRLAGHSGDRGLDDHDIDVGSRVLAVDRTTRCHLIRPFSTACVHQRLGSFLVMTIRAGLLAVITWPG
jgi:hypothetical protein